jgi:hypothetical protein
MQPILPPVKDRASETEPDRHSRAATTQNAMASHTEQVYAV